MKKVKITVLKTTFDEELAREYGAGEGLFYYGDWIRKPGVAICALQRRAAPCHLQAGGYGGRVAYRL